MGPEGRWHLSHLPGSLPRKVRWRAVRSRIDETRQGKASRCALAFRDILNHCREKGEIPKDSDTEELALYLLGIANGINVLARLGRNMPDLEKIVKTSLDSIIK